MTSSSNKDMFKDIISMLRPYRWAFWGGTVSRIMSDLASLVPAWAFGKIVTFVAQYYLGQTLEYFWMMIGILVFFAFFRSVLLGVAKDILLRIAEKVRVDVLLKATKHLFELDLQWHQKENTRNKIQKIKRGSDSYARIISLYCNLFLESSISLIAVTIILGTVDLWVAGVLLFFFVSYFGLSFLMVKKTSLFSHRENTALEHFDGSQYEMVNNISTAKALGITSSLFALLEVSAKKLLFAIFRRIRVMRFRQAIVSVYRNLFRVILLTFTAIQALNGHFEVGVIAMVFSYFERIETSADELASTTQEVILARIAVFRMQEILDTSPEIESLGKRNFPLSWREISFENVHFSYGERKVLNGFSLNIRRGEKIGLVGLSGAGKSTLLKLLLKLYENYEGNILFDGIPLSEFKRSSYLKQVAVVLQDTEVFHLSLQDNIVLSQGKFVKKDLEKVLHISHLDGLLPRLSEGVETLIGEKGVKLSGGERQRLGIARALYKNPNLLYMDEATSHLDIESEQAIQEALHKNTKGMTLVVIAHRLATLKNMDRIIVLHNGKIVEEGSFEGLSKKSKYFKGWRNKQQV